MPDTVTESLRRDPAAVAKSWSDYKAANPKSRARDAAAAIGVSEGELVATQVGAGGATPPQLRRKALLEALPTLGAGIALPPTDWAGPDAILKKVGIRLGAPNYPGDTMTMTGTVSAVDAATKTVTVDVVGANSRGNHVTGQVTLVLP